MAINLYLYSNITPNYDYKHYLFNDLSAFKTLLTPNLIKTISADKYTFINGFLRVAIDNAFNEEDASEVTYIIAENTNTNYFKCYHVSSYEIRSGFIVYNLMLDNWATYISKANIQNINVIKSNRRVGVGIYDPISPTNAQEVNYFNIANVTSGNNNEYFNVSNVCIVFCLKYNVYSTALGNATTQQLFKINLKDLKQKYVDMQSTTTDKLNASFVNAVDLAVAVVGGIVGVGATTLIGISTTNSAIVTQAWICEDNYIIGNTSLTREIKTRNMYMSSETTLDNTIVQDVIAIRMSRSFTITQDANNQYYYGTYQNNIKLPRFTENITGYIDYITSNDNVKVIARVGDLQQDITSAFEVGITTTSGDVTNLGLLRYAITTGLKTGASVVGIASKSEGLQMAGAINILSIGANNLIAENSKALGSTTPAGDGVTSWRSIFSGSDLQDYDKNINQPVKNPYALIIYTSTTDEEAKAQRTGANYDDFITSLNDLFNYNYLINGSDTTFIKANCNITEINTTASDIIKNKLMQGIYLVNL